MENPAILDGAFARTSNVLADIGTVTRRPSDFNNNVNKADLVAEFPIIAAHWFGIKLQAQQ